MARSLSGFKYPSSRYIDAVYDHKETLLSSTGPESHAVEIEVAAEELSTPLEVKVYYINSISLHHSSTKQIELNMKVLKHQHVLLEKRLR